MDVRDDLMRLEAYRRAGNAHRELATLRLVPDTDEARVAERIRSIHAAHFVPGEPPLALEERLLQLGVACARRLLGQLEPSGDTEIWVRGVLADLQIQLVEAQHRRRFTLEGPWVEVVLPAGRRCDALLLCDALGIDRQQLIRAGGDPESLDVGEELRLAATHVPVRSPGSDTWLEVVTQLLERPFDAAPDPDVLAAVVDGVLEGLPVARPPREWLRRHPRMGPPGRGRSVLDVLARAIAAAIRPVTR